MKNNLVYIILGVLIFHVLYRKKPLKQETLPFDAENDSLPLNNDRNPYDLYNIFNPKGELQ